LPPLLGGLLSPGLAFSIPRAAPVVLMRPWLSFGVVGLIVVIVLPHHLPRQPRAAPPGSPPLAPGRRRRVSSRPRRLRALPGSVCARGGPPAPDIAPT